MRAALLQQWVWIRAVGVAHIHHRLSAQRWRRNASVSPRPRALSRGDCFAFMGETGEASSGSNVWLLWTMSASLQLAEALPVGSTVALARQTASSMPSHRSSGGSGLAKESEGAQEDGDGVQIWLS
jgi:hypothetical protein